MTTVLMAVGDASGDAYAADLSDLAFRLDHAIQKEKPTKRIVASIRSRTRKVKNDVSKTLKAVQSVRTNVSI